MKVATTINTVKDYTGKSPNSPHVVNRSFTKTSFQRSTEAYRQAFLSRADAQQKTLNDTFSIEATQITRTDQNVTSDTLGSPLSRANAIKSALKTTPTIIAPQEIVNNGILTASSVNKQENTEQKQYFAKRYALKGAAGD